VGGILLAIATAVIAQGAHWRAAFRAVEAAEPARLTVDLSRTGEYTGALRQMYHYGHDEGLELHVSPPLGEIDDAWPALQGVAGRVVIKSKGGWTLFEGPLGLVDSMAWRYRHYGAMPIALFRPFAPGDYTVSIRVDTPVPALAGRSQQVLARHWLCGCEGLMAANFAFMIGGVIGLAGVIALIGGIVGGTHRHLSAPVGDGPSSVRT